MNIINNSKCETIANNIATTINAMATIYNKDSYKVSVYPASAEGSHKENHVSVVVRKDDEAGNLAVCDGRVLNGNLSQKNINWCREVLLTEENKVRINQMIETNDYYRLDRPDEIANHPLFQNNEKKAATCTEQQTPVKWEDTFVQDIKHLNYYKFLITFADGSGAKKRYFVYYDSEDSCYKIKAGVGKYSFDENKIINTVESKGWRFGKQMDVTFAQIVEAINNADGNPNAGYHRDFTTENLK